LLTRDCEQVRVRPGRLLVRESILGVRDPCLEPPHHVMEHDARTVELARAECLLQAGLANDVAQFLGNVFARPELPAPAEHPPWKGHLHSPFVAVFRSIRTEENAAGLMLSGVLGLLALPTGFEPVF